MSSHSGIKVISNIWDDKYVLKTTEGWTCVWCKQAFTNVNSNRILSHLARIPVHGVSGIRSCAGNITDEKIKEYQYFANRKNDKHYSKKNLQAEGQMFLVNRTNVLANKLDAMKTKSCKSSSTTQQTDENGSIELSGLQLTREPLSDLTMVSFASSKKKPPSYNEQAFVQTQLDFANQNHRYVKDNQSLDVAIADFIHSKGLPFATVEDIKFKHMIFCATNASRQYKAPTRQQISGEYLDLLYNQYIDDSKNNLEIDQMVYGLSIMGDGATIKKKPLFNVLVSGVYCPIFVADIHDASDDLAEGCNKGAKYVKELCFKIAKEIDPHKNLLDLVLFDGANSVQAAGACIAYFYPRASCLHGVEHVCGLFCKYLLLKTKIGSLVNVYRLLYRYFGSGSTHMAYAIFKKYAKELNHTGLKIGLVQAAGTRMGGYFYAFHRLLRLKKALKQTIVSNEWEKVTFDKKTMKDTLEGIIENENFFTLVKMVVIVLYPVIQCLRLADTNKAGMDKIHYYTRMASKRINDFCKEFNNAWDNDYFEMASMEYELASKKQQHDDDSSCSESEIDEEEVALLEQKKEELKKNALNKKLKKRPKVYSTVYDSSDSSDSEEERKIKSKTKAPIAYDSSDSEDESVQDPEAFGYQLKSLWQNTEKLLASDFAIAGWLLSVVPHIYNDAKGYTKEDEEKLRKIAKKLLSHLHPALQTDAVNKCMEQFKLFRHKSGCFTNLEWWSSEYVYSGESHLWHGHYTCLFAKELGFVACRVTSKLLGIGNCERQWDQTKYCCLGRRSLISSNRLKKQCIIYGSHSQNNARNKNMLKDQNLESEIMSDTALRVELDSFAKEKEANFTLKKESIQMKKQKMSVDLFNPLYQSSRRYNAYYEPWEKKVVHKRDYRNHCRLLAKYQNLKYVWPEDPGSYAAVINPECLFFVERTDNWPKGKPWGWHVILIPKGQEFYNELIDEYEKQPFDHVDFHLLIASTQQDDDVFVYDEGDSIVDAKEKFEEYFPTLKYRKFDEFPDNDDLNCDPRGTYD